MSKPLPYGRQFVDQSDIDAIVDVLKSDYLTTGPQVGRFEAELERLTGAKYAIALTSGTSALHAMYVAAGLSAGDEIVTSPLTFAATANAALYVGAKVRFIDIEPDTGNLDPEQLGSAVNSATRLVVPIDYAGHPADYDRISEAIKGRDVTVVADAAHSLGAKYQGRPVGTLAAATEVSFHPVKPITTAEGGAVLTSDRELAETVQLFRTHGITKSDEQLELLDEGPWWYEQHLLGFNYRLTDIQAALGFSQLQRLDSFISRRRQIAQTYTAELADVQELELPVEREDVESGWHLYVIRVRDASKRRRLFEKLRELGLGVQVHYLPVYYHPYYRELGYERGLCPVAEDFYERAISVPIYPLMSDNDVTSSIERIREAVRLVH